ncbi:MAG: PQQ-binding-like beta-propeller repeat protein [Bacteroidetes bacterium]|nr:PQQ-binding-like beta-propeller repeat protein [Bacteroidota bacterium]
MIRMKKLIFFASLSFFTFPLFCQNYEINPERQWSVYRGPHSGGFLDGANLPDTWDVEQSENIKWKRDIPGLAHSGPVIWGDKVFLTTAVSQFDNHGIRTGIFGDGEPVDDDSEHDYIVYCIDRNTGKIIWERTSYRGIPEVKRHPKSTHANCTPVTDGKYVVAFFGSEGLYCYDMNGNFIWEKDFGRLDAGAFNADWAKWEFASSPVIHKGVVIVQCDVRGDSFLAAFEASTGREIWRKTRDEHPTWCTPNIYEHNGREFVVVNGYKHRGGYDFKTGEEVWKMSGGGDVPIPTPVIGEDLIYFNSAHGRLSPIYAIRKTARGDISLEEGQTHNDYIKWSIHAFFITL